MSPDTHLRVNPVSECGSSFRGCNFRASMVRGGQRRCIIQECRQRVCGRRSSMSSAHIPAHREVGQVPILPKHIIVDNLVAGFPGGHGLYIRRMDSWRPNHQTAWACAVTLLFLKLSAARCGHSCVMTGAFVPLSSACAPVAPPHEKTEQDARCHSAKHFANMFELLGFCVLCVVAVAAFAIRIYIREGRLERRFSCRFSGRLSRRHRGRLKCRRRRHF